MSYKTLTAITQDVIKRIGLVSGTGVQRYTEPQVAMTIQDAFDFLFRKRFWDHLSGWYTFTPNGSTGVVTDDLSTIAAEPTDIREIYITGTDRRVVQPVGNEHLLVNNSDYALYYTAWKYTATGGDQWKTKVIKLWPVTCTQDVTMHIRVHPGIFNDNDIVPFPQDIIGWCSAWLMLETDGINPANANKAQAMFDISYRDYINSIGDDAIGHGGVRTREYVTIR